jgi:PAS domain-containing protein
MSCAEPEVNDLPYQLFWEGESTVCSWRQARGVSLRSARMRAASLGGRVKWWCWPVWMRCLIPKTPPLNLHARNGNLPEASRAHCTLCVGIRKTFPAEISVAVCRDGGRELMGIVFRDMTERKRAEDALKESEERYSRSIELFPKAEKWRKWPSVTEAEQRCCGLCGT